jgi:hypothetical protein
MNGTFLASHARTAPLAHRLAARALPPPGTNGTFLELELVATEVAPQLG